MEKIVLDARSVGELCPVCGKEVVAIAVASTPIRGAICQRITYSCRGSRRNHLPRDWQPAAVPA